MVNNQDFFGYNTIFWMGVVEDRQECTHPHHLSLAVLV